MIDVLPFVILALHFVDKWFLSQGKLWYVYLLTILGSACTIAYNGMLWTELQYNHRSILLFAVNSIWTMTMAVKGIHRLIAEEKKSDLTA
jgi:hypothetical protein